MRPERDLDQLEINQAKKGDLNAFEALVKRYQRMVYRLCFHLTGNHMIAEDLAQETFLKAYVNLPHFLDGYDFCVWLRKMALNLCLTFLRKNKRERRFKTMDELHNLVVLIPAMDSPEETLERKEAKKKFLAALHSLPEDQKTVFILKTYENMSYQEIALATGWKMGTVMSRLNRARKKLRENLAPYWGGKK